MTLEYISDKRTLYLEKQNYFKNIGFEHLAEYFQGVVNLIDEMENYIKEKENGKDV